MTPPLGGRIHSGGETYTHGHDNSVLRSHRWRTAENSAGYLLRSLEPGQHLLDVGCGPGTITIDLAARVAPGTVVGIDDAAAVIAEAEELGKRRNTTNVAFATGNVYNLAFEDKTFDVAHAHQLLQHLRNPERGLREMRRVLRPGGLLAVRDSDYAAFAWAPRDPHLDRWLELHHQVTVHNGAEANAGRCLLGWVQAAGFSNIQTGSSTWTFADREARAWWGGLWADRMQLSSFADQAIAYRLSDRDELQALANAWRRWALQPAGFFAVVHGEVLAHR